MRSTRSLNQWRVGDRLSEVDTEQLVAAFTAGTSKRKLAEQYSISENSVKRLIRQHGGPSRRGGRLFSCIWSAADGSLNIMRFGTGLRWHAHGKAKSNRAIANAARKIFLVAGTVMSMLALSPDGWLRALGDWADFFLNYRTFLLGLFIVVLGFQLVLARQPFLARLEYMAPVQYQGVPDMLPRGIQDRVVGVLDELGQSSPAEHLARIVVLTGGSTLHYLEQVIERYPTRSNWDIRVLIADPESPEIGLLGKDARDQVLASCARLATMKGRIASRVRPAKLAWRGYLHLPMVRGLALDEEHIFFGFFVWGKQDGAWRLYEQNKRLVHARRGDDLSRDSIEFFISWFDYEWLNGRDLEGIL